MMDEILVSVDALAEMERRRIVSKYGAGYHSLHEVLAVNDRNTMMVGFVEFRTYGGTRFCVCEDIDSGIGITHVTHWMPLPEPPEEGEA